MKKILLATLLLTSFLNGCKKDDVVIIPPTVKENVIAVKLDNSYMPASKVDSAIITWELNGQVQQEKMQLSNDSVYANIKKFTKGNGRLGIQLYTKTKLKQQDLQWERRMELNLKHEESLVWNAPADVNENGWFPRIIMIDAPTGFTAIVGIRPADPYFMLKNIPAGFKIELERGYWVIPGGAISVAHGLWKCNTVCTDSRGIIENREFFSNLLAATNGREWKMLDVGVGLFSNNPANPGPSFYFNYW